MYGDKFNTQSKKINIVFNIILFMAFLVFGQEVLAQANNVTQQFGEACGKVEGFFKNFETILKVISITIVTIAIVFAGYQVSFAHKRLSDIAPILIGGLLIGGAATIAGWFVAGWATTGCT